MRAGALGRVEREGMRRGVFERDARRGAHQVAGVEALLFGTVVVDGHRTLALAQRLPERGHHPVAGLLADDQAVDHQVDGVYLVTVEAHTGRNLADLAVNTGIDIPLFGQRLEQFAVMPLAAFDDGSHQGDLAPREARHDEPGDLLVGIMHHLLTRDGRIGTRRARVEQAQEIVDLGHGTHRGTGIFVGGLLLDGDHGTQARDLVDIGTLHRPHELAGIGGKRLHVAALSLGVDRVERQGRLARTGKAGYDYQFAARDLQVDVFQVMNPGSQYFDRVFFHHRSQTYRKPRLVYGLSGANIVQR